MSGRNVHDIGGRSHSACLSPHEIGCLVGTCGTLVTAHRERIGCDTARSAVRIIGIEICRSGLVRPIEHLLPCPGSGVTVFHVVIKVSGCGKAARIAAIVAHHIDSDGISAFKIGVGDLGIEVEGKVDWHTLFRCHRCFFLGAGCGKGNQCK